MASKRKNNKKNEIKKKSKWTIKIKNMKKFWFIMACVYIIFIILGIINGHFDYLSFIMLMLCFISLSVDDKEK